MCKPMFTVFNYHSERCGQPPEFSNKDSNHYYGYFENVYGEQWIFSYDKETGKAELFGGDNGWENSYEIIEDQPPKLVLQQEEKAWLGACWNAVKKRYTS